MVLGVTGWNRKEFPESNLHVCCRDVIKIAVYNMGRCTKKGDRRKIKEFEKKTANSRIILFFNKYNII